MSEWKEERVRARLARQGAEDRATPPAKKKPAEREWLIVCLQICTPWKYVRLADGSWRQLNEFEPTKMHIRSRHRTEGDARRELEKHQLRPHRAFIAHVCVYERLRPLWS